MNIVMLNLAFKTDIENKRVWVTVPPQNYGGVQWVIKNTIDGLLHLGHKVTLLGAPGSPKDHPNLTIVDIAEDEEIEEWLIKNKGQYDILHNHTCRGPEFKPMFNWHGWKVVHTHHISSPPGEQKNVIAISKANAIDIGIPNAPVVRNPVNPDHYIYSDQKEDFLLFLGRIAPWKGALTAAKFAKKVGLKLVIAGPCFKSRDFEYFYEIMSEYHAHVEYIGSVGGEDRKLLLAKAKAILVFSNGDVEGTSGRPWVEPGALVVSEAGVSGTPTISSTNGCLKEITPYAGIAIEDIEKLSESDVKEIIKSLPDSKSVRANSIEQWGHIKIAKEYIKLYKQVLEGKDF